MEAMEARAWLAGAVSVMEARPEKAVMVVLARLRAMAALEGLVATGVPFQFLFRQAVREPILSTPVVPAEPVGRVVAVGEVVLEEPLALPVLVLPLVARSVHQGYRTFQGIPPLLALPATLVQMAAPA